MAPSSSSLVVGEVARVDAPQRLSLDELAQEFHDGEDEFEEVLLDRLVVGPEPARGARGLVGRGGRGLEEAEGVVQGAARPAQGR